MKSFHIPRTALFFILFALAAFAVLYHPIDLKALVRASSQGTLRTEEVAHFGSTNDMDYHLCLLYTSPSPRDRSLYRMPSSA